MKRVKKILSIVLSITMLLSITTSIDLSAYAYTNGCFAYSVSGSNATITGYNSTSTSVTIPSKIMGYTVTSIGGSAFSNCTSLKSVTIPDSVTRISNDAFENCTSLTSVTIGNSVTSIGKYAFSSCTSLTSVTIPNSVKSIGDYAFYLVNNIVYNGSASGSPWGAKSVNGYVDGYLVYRDSTKKELLGCSSQATSVTIPNSVTSIGNYAFRNCTSLTNVTIPNSVTSIGESAFYECTSLRSVTIPNSVKSIGDGAFAYCSSLTSITIPNSVTSIGSDAFYYCRSLTSVTIPNSVTSIGDWAFGDCISLTSITIPNSVTSIGDYAFTYCTGLKSVTIPNSVTSIGNYAFRNCTSLTNVTIPNSVTSIGNGAFEYCSSLTSVTIPNSVTSIGSDAFWNCTSLTSVTIGNSVTSIGEDAFYWCTSLTSVTIPNSVTSIGDRAFEDCTRLTSVTIPNSVTSIGDYAFYRVNNIVYNGTASGSPWGAKSVNGYVDGYLVYNDSTKKEILGCSGQAASVTIPNSVTSIGEDAFYECTNLRSVTIPNSVTSIGNGAFKKCISLTSITIPNNVTSIGEDAFYWCTSLTSVTIPNSVTSIGEDAFYYCTSLTDVYYTGSETQWNNISIGSYNNDLEDATIHYNYVPPCNHNIVTDKAVASTCTKTGLTEGSHCTICGEVLKKQEVVDKTAHTYKNYVTKATLIANGKIVNKCSVCGVVKSTTVIPMVKTITISATNYNYDGKVKTPAVTVKDSKGKTLRKGTDYDVTYSSGRKNVGKYAVKITFKGNYSGSKTLYFTINPKGTSISKITAAKKGFKVYWKKQSTQTTGYQIQYSTSSKFSKSKTVTLTKNSYTSKSISKLSAKKKYYVRVRTYKKVGSTYYYSSWSKVKYVTTK